MVVVCLLRYGVIFFSLSAVRSSSENKASVISLFDASENAAGSLKSRGGAAASVRREAPSSVDSVASLLVGVPSAGSGIWHSAAADQVDTQGGEAKPSDGAKEKQAAAATAMHKGLLKDVRLNLASYGCAALVVFSAVVLLYGNRGPRVVFVILCYLGFLSTMKLTVKWVFVHNAFSYAKLVSATHFLMGAVASFCILLHRKSQGRPIPYPTRDEFVFMMLPVSSAVVISIGANNMALVFSTASFTEIIGSTNCLVTVLMVWLLGLPFNWMLLFPTFLVAAGCAISTAGEINFSLLGMVLCFTSNVFRSVKVTLQQKLMTGETKEKFDPCALLLWISLPCFIVMLLGSLLTEGFAPYKQIATLDSHHRWSLFGAVFFSAVNATALNLAQLFVNKDLGAVGSQLVAQCKAVLTVMGGMAIFGDKVSTLEAAGFLQVLVGVFIFSRIEQATKGKETQAQLSEHSKDATASIAKAAHGLNYKSMKSMQPQK